MMSRNQTPLLILISSGQRVSGQTHLHKEKTGHNVGAGFQLAPGCREAPHWPPLGRGLTVNHLWEEKFNVKLPFNRRSRYLMFVKGKINSVELKCKGVFPRLDYLVSWFLVCFFIMFCLIVPAVMFSVSNS